MSKKIKENDGRYSVAEKELTQMRLPDLKRACVSRGMPFDEVTKSSIPMLHTWYINNYVNTIEPGLLEEYDIWMEQELEKLGYGSDHPYNHSSLKLGYIAKTDEDGEEIKPKAVRVKADKPAKVKGPKKERVAGTKILGGTKKGTTYALTREGKDLKDIIEYVVEKFPDANVKSVTIWHKRCLKEMKDEGKGT